MILQHLAGTAQDFEAICETIGKVQRLAKGPGDAPRGDGRREKEVHLASAENGSGDFNGVCGYCKKKAGHKRKDCHVRIAKQSESESDLINSIKGHVTLVLFIDSGCSIPIPNS